MSPAPMFCTRPERGPSSGGNANVTDPTHMLPRCLTAPLESNTSRPGSLSWPRLILRLITTTRRSQRKPSLARPLAPPIVSRLAPDAPASAFPALPHVFVFSCSSPSSSTLPCLSFTSSVPRLPHASNAPHDPGFFARHQCHCCKPSSCVHPLPVHSSPPSDALDSTPLGVNGPLPVCDETEIGRGENGVGVGGGGV